MVILILCVCAKLVKLDIIFFFIEAILRDCGCIYHCGLL